MVSFYSTEHPESRVLIRDAILSGIAPSSNDRVPYGLWMPEALPRMSSYWIESLPQKDLPEIGFELLFPFFDGLISKTAFLSLCTDAFNFPIPLMSIGETEQEIYALELFHGPTLAFKDVAARFMARALTHLLDEPRTILVATSGDTGSAVAHGFYGVEGLDVVVLYPSKRVSELQEKQLTCLGGNIKAVEVEGSFDDCQALVKKALADEVIQNRRPCTTANSINVARLLPQMVYYFFAWKQACEIDATASWLVSVPSGNFGNLTAGLMAQQMGCPFRSFIASNNRNKAVYDYLQTGKYSERPTIATISNAMDVGAPSNFNRIKDLFSKGSGEAGESSAWNKIRQVCRGFTADDRMTHAAISAVYQKCGYTMDPHGAVAYLGLMDSLANYQDSAVKGIFLETAHPAKFLETVRHATGQEVELPARLAKCLDAPKQAVTMENSYEAFRDMLLQS